MLKLALAFAIAWGLAVPAAEARPQKVDWSEYLESPSERAKGTKQKKVSAKKKAKAKKAPKKRAAKKQKAKKRGKRRR